MKSFVSSVLWVSIGIFTAVILNYFFTSAVVLGIGSGLLVGVLLESFLGKKESTKKK